MNGKLFLQSKIVGQTHITNVISKLVDKHALPKCMVFAGVSGTGKLTLVQEIAEAVDASVSVLKTFTVTDQLNVLNIIYYEPERSKLLLVLDHAESGGKDFFKSLNSTLRAAPDFAHVIIITDSVENLPRDLLGLAMNFEFKALEPTNVFKILVEQYPDQDKKFLAAVALKSRGVPTQAFKWVKLATNLGFNTVEEFQKEFGSHNTAIKAISEVSADHLTAAQELIPQDTEEAYQIFLDMLDVLKDCVLIKSGSDPNCLPNLVAERKEFAKSVDGQRIASALKLCWNYQQRIKDLADKTQAVRTVLALIHELWNPRKTVEKASEQKTPISKVDTPVGRPLTMEEMQALAAS